MWAVAITWQTRIPLDGGLTELACTGTPSTRQVVFKNDFCVIGGCHGIAERCSALQCVAVSCSLINCSSALVPLFGDEI
jgi:hypothetical protein